MDSENRDTPVWKAIEKAADALDTLLASGRAPDVLRKLDLDRRRGPTLLALPQPTRAADEHAQAALRSAIAVLEETYASLGMTSLRGGAAHTPWTIEIPARRDGIGASIGFPVIGAFSPVAIYELSRLIPALRLGPLAQMHPQVRRLLTEYLLAENEQWATWLGYPMPYAFRYRALTWVWSPEAHQANEAYGICLRCGVTLARTRATHTGAPLCAHCVKERNKPWPEHAIAPTTKGRWILRCKTIGCDATFEGAGQRRYCERHQKRKQSVRRR